MPDRSEFRCAAFPGLARRRLWRGAHGTGHHRALRRDASRPAADERLRLDRDHIAGHHDAAVVDCRARRQRRARAALRRHPRDGRERARSAGRPRGRALARRADGREGVLGQPGRDIGEFRRRVLALGRHRLEGCARLRARLRPKEGHDQPRRLQDLLRRGRERADVLAGRRGGGRGGAVLPRARRARARVCRDRDRE